MDHLTKHPLKAPWKPGENVRFCFSAAHGVLCLVRPYIFPPHEVAERVRQTKLDLWFSYDAEPSWN